MEKMPEILMVGLSEMDHIKSLLESQKSIETALLACDDILKKCFECNLEELASEINKIGTSSLFEEISKILEI